MSMFLLDIYCVPDFLALASTWLAALTVPVAVVIVAVFLLAAIAMYTNRTLEFRWRSFSFKSNPTADPPKPKTKNAPKTPKSAKKPCQK
jgi:hypothetical protein